MPMLSITSQVRYAVLKSLTALQNKYMVNCIAVRERDEFCSKGYHQPSEIIRLVEKLIQQTIGLKLCLVPVE